MTDGGANPGVVLDVWFPKPELDGVETAETVVLDAENTPAELRELVGTDEARGVKTVAVHTGIADLSAAPVDAYDVYLRLHLLSHRLIKPHGANLEGIFGLLTLSLIHI